MKLQGVAASPGVVFGFTRVLREVPRGLAAPAPISETVSTPEAESRALKSPPLQGRLASPGNRQIVVASSMTGHDLLRSCQEGAVGVILEHCLWNSETMVLARSLGLPLVSGVGPGWEEIPNQVPIVLDGTRGIVSLPDSSEPDSSGQTLPEEVSPPDFPDPIPAVTRDGITIRMLLTLEFDQQIHPQLLSAADGIGLWRRDRPYWLSLTPDTTEGFRTTFRGVVDQFQGQELQIALSPPRELPGAHDQSQTCTPLETGCEGWDFEIRPRREWLIPQIEALFEIAQDHPVTILFSRIDSRQTLERSLASLSEMAGGVDRGTLPIRVGVLLESPSLAFAAREWLPLVDNLAIDWDELARNMAGPEPLPTEVDPLGICLAPPVLRLLRELTDLSRNDGTRLTLCGQLFGNPRLVAVALALGFRRLSVTPSSFRSVQQTICQISDRGLGELRHLVYSDAPATEINRWLQQHMCR